MEGSTNLKGMVEKHRKKVSRTRKKQRLEQEEDAEPKVVADESDEFPPDDDLPERRATVNQRRYTNMKGIRKMQRMMNEMRRRRTLARASLSRSKFSGQNDVELIDNTDYRRKTRSDNAPRFYRMPPETHSEKWIKDEQARISKLCDFEEITEAEDRLQNFICNYTTFAVEMNNAVDAARQLEQKKVEEDKRDYERKKQISMEREAMRSEDDCLRFPEVEQAPCATVPITTFFAVKKGGVVTETERFYHDFYYENIVDNPEPVNTPGFEETYVYDEHGPPKERAAGELLPDDTSDCPSCKGEDTLHIDEKTGYLTCHGCGTLFDSASRYNQSYAEIQSSSVKTNAPYERISHFKEYMTRLEGMERTEIPEEIIHCILIECEKRGINPVQEPEKLTYARMRQFLSDAGYSHCFENIVKIMTIVTQRNPVALKPEQRAELERRFKEIQEPFMRHKGKRKNFLSYAYTMYKLCELLGYNEFLPYLQLLKAAPNLIKADQIWKKICEDLQWEFVPTDPA